jgi:hypothetical protein
MEIGAKTWQVFYGFFLEMLGGIKRGHYSDVQGVP